MPEETDVSHYSLDNKVTLQNETKVLYHVVWISRNEHSRHLSKPADVHVLRPLAISAFPQSLDRAEEGPGLIVAWREILRESETPKCQYLMLVTHKHPQSELISQKSDKVCYSLMTTFLVESS